MKKIAGVFSAAVLVLTLHAPARGVDLSFGANVNLCTENNFGLGPRVEVGLGEYVPGLRLAADYHKFFESEVYSDIEGRVVKANAWDLGIHVIYDFAKIDVLEGATLYVGAGLLHAERRYDHWQELTTDGVAADESFQKLQEKYESDSGTSFALTVGSTFNTGWTVHPFVEARYTIGVVDELMVAAGLLFSTGLGSK